MLTQKNHEIRFLLIFIGCYAVLHTLYFIVPDEVLRDVFHHYGIVLLSANIINYFAPLEHVLAIENRLESGTASLSIIRGCDGAGVVFLLIAAIVAFRADIKQKLLGLLAGITLLYIINQLRIIGLYFVVVYEKEWFLPIHSYFAPTLIIILTTVFFAGWAFKSSGNFNRHDSAEIARH